MRVQEQLTTHWMHSRRRHVRAGALLVALGVAPLPGVAGSPDAHAAAPANAFPEVVQVGTTGTDRVVATAPAPGGSFVLGETSGALSPTPGQEPVGGEDLFVARVDAGGQPIWVRLLGSTADEQAGGLAVAANGDIVVTGSTRGSVIGLHRGLRDIVVARYSAAGTRRWVRQFGTAADDHAASVAITRLGAVFVGGSSSGRLGPTARGGDDAVVMRLDGTGHLRWAQQFGTARNDRIAALAVDRAGNVFFAGSTDGRLRYGPGTHPGTGDIIVGRVADSRRLAWIRQLGSAGTEVATGLAVDGMGSLLVLATTTGSLGGANHGDTDVYLARLNSRGFRLAEAQFGTPERDWATGLAIAADGDVFVAGTTFGTMNRASAGGGGDVFVARFDLDAKRKWVHQFGTSSMDEALTVSVRADGTVVAGGYTNELIGTGQYEGGVDGFLSIFPAARNAVWLRQSGSSGDDLGTSVNAGPNGMVHVGASVAGDAVVAKYSANGRRLWTVTLGGPGADATNGVASLANGDVVAVGRTENWLAPQVNGEPTTSLGQGDVFVALYTFQGSLRWVRQFGSTADDSALTVAVGPNDEIYVAGTTGGSLSDSVDEANPNDRLDGFLTRFDRNGTRLWTHQFGSGEDDIINSVTAAANGAVYLGGATFGTVSPIPEEVSRDGFDGFVARYNDGGVREWIHQFGTESSDVVRSVTANPAGGVSFVGSSGGPLAAEPSGGDDLIVGHYTANGTLAWLNQWGTLYNDSANGVTALGNGDIVLVGQTDGSLVDASSGFTDAFVLRYTSLGLLVGGEQFGRVDNDVFNAVSARNGRVFAVGVTSGSLNEANQAAPETTGTNDLVVARLVPTSTSPV